MSEKTNLTVPIGNSAIGTSRARPTDRRLIRVPRTSSHWHRLATVNPLISQGHCLGASYRQTRV